MKLDNWIEQTGPKKVAKLLRVDPSTVSQWRNGRAFPRPKKLVRIYKISGGKVSYAEMVHHFAKASK